MIYKFFALILIAATVSCSAQESTSNLNNLNWLLGKWTRENVKPGRTAFEIWGQVSDSEFDGVGYSLRGTDTIFVEKLKIIEKDSELFYVAFVTENPEPVYFKFTSIGKKGFVSENQNHDFPKKIDYTWDGKKLVARISGDGRSAEFVFTKSD